MVQIPEKCSEDSDAFKAGYNTICDLAKARLKKAINQIYGNNSDVGFRVLKCDSSNMKDVYYSPAVRAGG